MLLETGDVCIKKKSSQFKPMTPQWCECGTSLFILITEHLIWSDKSCLNQKQHPGCYSLARQTVP
jgi:hypothetical protein